MSVQTLINTLTIVISTASTSHNGTVFIHRYQDCIGTPTIAIDVVYVMYFSDTKCLFFNGHQRIKLKISFIIFNKFFGMSSCVSVAEVT